MLILRDAHAGFSGFDQFRKSLGITPTMLKHLSVLVDEGLLEKREYSEHPAREEYVLTQAGKDFLPVFICIGGGNISLMNIQKKMVTFLDAENDTKIKPIIIDQMTGEKNRYTCDSPT